MCYDESVLLLLSCFSCVRLCDPIDGSPPGPTIPGILQARIVEGVAISFSNDESIIRLKVHWKPTFLPSWA